MNDYQARISRLLECLEEKGHHIIEVYDSANFLQVYVDGERKSLLDLSRMAVKSK